MAKCRRCGELMRAKAADLVLFTPMQMDRCPTNLWLEREGERIRSSAIAMHAAAGHPNG
jgi:hypothetical protein